MGPPPPETVSGPEVLQGITIVERCMSYVAFQRGFVGLFSWPGGAHAHHFSGGGGGGPAGQGDGDCFAHASGVRHST